MVRRIALPALLSGALAALLVVPSGAGAAVLYDQTGTAPAGYIASHDFSSPNDQYDAQGVDDFTLPAAGPWKIQAFDGVGFSLFAPTTGRVDIYADSGTSPGAVLFEQDGLTLTGPGSSVSFALSDGPVLGPGSYWVSLQTSDTTEWDWGYMSVQHGDPARWRNPGNGFATGCMAYQPLASCGISGTDFVFRVDGQLSQAPSPPVTKKKKCKKHKHRSASAAKKHCKKKKH